MKKIINDKNFELRDDQVEAVAASREYFENNDRGQLIKPCGTGKTVTSIAIWEDRLPDTTVVFVPSLNLLKQTKDNFKKYSDVDFDYLCVCSDKSVDDSNLNEEDEVEIEISEVDDASKVTTNSDDIVEFLNKENDGKPKLIYSTYNSSEQIVNAVESLPEGFKFDLSMIDEAHKTATRTNDLNYYNYPLRDEYIPVDKRVFLTATPKVEKQTFADDGNEMIYSMDNEEVYGKEFYHMTYRYAIENDIISDYKIIAVGITRDEKVFLEEYFQEHGIHNDLLVKEFYYVYALHKAMKEYGIKKTISFHSDVANAKSFFEKINLFKEHIDIEDLNTSHVNGKMKADQRNDEMDKYAAKGEKSIITNCNCLTEGIDVPATDAVFFSDNKTSIIAIVQAVGRAMRKALEKELGYIILPMLHSDDSSLESKIDEGNFKNIITVLKALASSDERIAEEVKAKRKSMAESEDGVDSSDLTGDAEERISYKGFDLSFVEAVDLEDTGLFFTEIEKSVGFNKSNFETSFERFKEILEELEKPENIEEKKELQKLRRKSFSKKIAKLDAGCVLSNSTVDNWLINKKEGVAELLNQYGYENVIDIDFAFTTFKKILEGLEKPENIEEKKEFQKLSRMSFSKKIAKLDTGCVLKGSRVGFWLENNKEGVAELLNQYGYENVIDIDFAFTTFKKILEGLEKPENIEEKKKLQSLSKKNFSKEIAKLDTRCFLSNSTVVDWLRREKAGLFELLNNYGYENVTDVNFAFTILKKILEELEKPENIEEKKKLQKLRRNSFSKEIAKLDTGCVLSNSTVSNWLGSRKKEGVAEVLYDYGYINVLKSEQIGAIESAQKDSIDEEFDKLKGDQDNKLRQKGKSENDEVQ
ncbi:MAG: DEAD/DEAH box helicase family protein [Alphaproteobacteria bacterium]|jgi:superfamily II DNA or RNA helicase|nr:DEAD/DEAH box helicase family protein [Alphaproteobacteria bacterium]